MRIILLIIGIFPHFIHANFNHSQWDAILKDNVSEKGLVDYQSIHENQKPLNEYLDLLAKNHPNEKWSANESKAYWINAYNAFTVKLIIDNYPVESIKEIGGKLYKINTPWDVKFITLGKETYDLNNIEHNILRKQFNDPRIHFAINCASISCPLLRNEAYEAATLEIQLENQATTFINDTSKNLITKDKVQLSKIFSWFKGDFTKDSSLLEFINKYATTSIEPTQKIDFMDYDWLLNKIQ